MNNYICPDCGAALDPGEKCGCAKEKAPEERQIVIVRQLPIIEEHLKLIKSEVEAEVKEALAIVPNEESLSAIKGIRAALNNKFKACENTRKEAKAAVMRPYDEFLEKYNKYVKDVFTDADEQLKKRKDAIEGDIKLDKSVKIKGYFDELAASENLEWLRFEESGIKILMSTSMNKLIEEAKSYVKKVASDVELIKTQEHSAEILYEYKLCLDLSKAVKSVLNRHKSIDFEQNSKADNSGKASRVDEIMKSLSAPEEKGAERRLLSVTFTVQSYDIEDFKLIKNFLENMKKERGLNYEQC